MAKVIETPLMKDTVAKLRLGETVFLTGTVFTARDKGHQRMLKRGSPVDLENAVIFHAGPIARKSGANWEIVAIGPTTSSRLNAATPKLLDRYNVRAIIGKAGMDDGVAKAMRKHKVVYLAMTGGSAALGAKAVRSVRVKWPDLGVAEAFWILEVDRLGPLVVAIDAKGNSLYKKVGDRACKNLKALVK